MRAPGLFFYLDREGVVSAAQLEPLLSRLPPEQIVQTRVRDGEGFDSLRWPVERDARLASFVARRFGLPLVDATLAAIERAADEPARLRALARQASARVLAHVGADFALFQRLWHDADEDDRLWELVELLAGLRGMGERELALVIDILRVVARPPATSGRYRRG